MPEQNDTAAPEDLGKDPFDIDEPQGEKLNRSRHFGTTAGEPVKKYFQDGKYFDYADNLVKEG